MKEEFKKSDRAISLNAVIDAIEYFQINPQHFDFVNLIDDIKGLPPVIPNEEEMTIKYIEGYNAGFCHAQAIFQKERPTGHWIEHKNIGECTYYECSECGEEIFCDKSNFCPSCGANMKIHREEEK